MLDSHPKSAPRRALAAGALVLVTACVTVGSSAPAATAATPQGAVGEVSQQTPAWRVRTMEHVDLWLHGFALLTSDTGHVPFFIRDYKRDMTARKREQNVHSQLDANQQELSSRFATNPSLTNAQFLAMYFSSLDEIVNATDFFFRAQGDPRAASDPRLQQQIAMLAANFPSGADRNWLRLFVQSLRDESSRFFHAYWVGEQAKRGAAFAAVNELWAQSYPKLSRFLNNTQQSRGEVLLSLPIGGEGRTINDGKQSNIVAVIFPKTIEAAPEALFVFAHEVVGRLAQDAITDNVTPAEQRSGAANEYIGNGAVRGGALLLQHILPDRAPDYMRFYLRTLGRTPPAGDPSAAFAAAFPLPTTIVNAMNTQIGIVLGGI